MNGDECDDDFPLRFFVGVDMEALSFVLLPLLPRDVVKGLFLVVPLLAGGLVVVTPFLFHFLFLSDKKALMLTLYEFDSQQFLLL